jgi:serine protease Do
MQSRTPSRRDRAGFRPLALSLVLALGMGGLVEAAGVSGCKRLTGDSAGGSGELPSGAIPVPSNEAKTAPAAPAAPAPIPATVATAGAAVGLPVAPFSFAPIAHRADPSVVTISTIETTEEVSPLFFNRTRRREQKGLGTGFIIDKDGVILTNNHVVEGAEEITVALSDERTFPAKVVGTDPHTDMAVIRIAASGFTPLPLGDSDAIDVGDWVVAIGNPYGLAHTVSAGIVSAKGRTRDDVPLGDPSGYYNFIQTDASINPGNSGGPLLNLKGEVVGMNTAVHAQGQNIGFAIPMNMVKQLLPMLLRDGHVTRSALGVGIRPVRSLPPEDRAQLKISEEKGVVVDQVFADGPAAKAGLEVGDVIVAFDGEQVDRPDRLKWLASVAGVGRQVTLRIERGGKRFDEKITLGALSDRPSGRGRGAP